MIDARSPAGRPHAPLAAVVSGKGGVGKTSLAVNLALAAAGRRRRTLLLDGDLGFADADVLLGMLPPAAEHTLFATPDSSTLHAAIQEAPLGLELLPGPCADLSLARRPDAGAADLVRNIELLRKDRDLLVCDTGAGLAPPTLEVVQKAQIVLLVVTGEPAAFTDAYGMLKVMRDLGAAHAVHVVINRARDKSEAHTIAERLRRVASEFLALSPPMLGWVPEDAAVAEATRTQSAFILEQPKSRASRAVFEIAGQVVARTRRPDSEPSPTQTPTQSVAP